MPKIEKPVEAQLIAAAIKREGRSIRSVARDVGLSEARLRQIVNGYASGGAGVKIPVVAPAATLARIAFVLGIPPSTLRESGRGDAADEMVDFYVGERNQDAIDMSSQMMAALDELREYLESGSQRGSRTYPDDPPPAASLWLWPDEDLVQEIMDRLSRRPIERGVYSLVPGRFEVRYSTSERAKKWYRAQAGGETPLGEDALDHPARKVLEEPRLLTERARQRAERLAERDAYARRGEQASVESAVADADTADAERTPSEVVELKRPRHKHPNADQHLDDEMAPGVLASAAHLKKQRLPQEERP